MSKLISLATGLLAGAIVAQANTPVFRMEMTPQSGETVEAISNRTYTINGVHRGEPTTGYSGTGTAMRFDGYSTYITGEVGDLLAANRRKATFSIWVAPETYPLIAMRQTVGERIPLFGVFNNGNDIALWLGQNGEYSFMCTVGGEKAEAQFVNPLPCNAWSQITGVIDANDGKVSLFVNGELVSETDCTIGDINFNGGTMYIGRGIEERKDGVFGLNYFNGIIDDIVVYNDVVAPQAATLNPLTIAVPSTRFASDILRPAYHGMPSANWTNEPHGLMYSNGKYHLFHQRNANGTYMGRMHWGHLVSDNLYDWTEAPVALFPDKEGFDLWGCWSGCVVNDPSWNGGVPQIFYTGVDYNKATIARADVADSSDSYLMKWNKSGAVIAGTPTGFSDFRDPFVFSVDGKWYMVIGCGKDGKGCLVLSRYENGSWSNDGTVFFKDDNAGLGDFWEMPTVTKIDGKWLLTVSTINNGNNNTYYWVGDIATDGTFNATTDARKVELEDFAVNGYGLMSPSVLQKDGKTIVIGIVPDKLPSDKDVEKGWSHTFSLPREWHISDNNYLLQSPFEGLKSMRASNVVTGDGAQTLAVDGRRFEVSATFTAPTTGKFGYNIFKVGDKHVGVYYDMDTQKFYVDAANCDRLLTDGWESVCPGGVFSSALPENINAGEDVNIHLYVDNSIIDVFINNKWASSVRVFATDPNATGAEIFADASVTVKDVEAYNLNVTGSIAGVSIEQDAISGADPIDPTPGVNLDPTGMYEVDENGRDLKLADLQYHKLAILVRDGELNKYEQAALDHFKEECPTGGVIYNANPSDIATSKYECVWIHVDDNTSQEPFSQATIDALKSYVKAGGNLYLSGYATKIVNQIGRIPYAPNVVDVDGGMNSDVWTINALIDNEGEHFLFKDLHNYMQDGSPKYPVIGDKDGNATYRVNRNCMWNLGNHGTNANDFQSYHNATILGTWGQENNGNIAGIVMFNSTVAYPGKIVANGIAGANQLAVTNDNETNHYAFNQRRMINNALFALAPTVDHGTPTGLNNVDYDANAISISAKAGMIVYGNLPEASIITVSDIQGRRLAQVAVSGNGTIDLPIRGIVIAQVQMPGNPSRVFKLAL